MLRFTIGCGSIARAADQDLAQAEAIRISDVVARWLVDIGCGFDLVANRAVRRYVDCLFEVHSITVATANCQIDAGIADKLNILDSSGEPIAVYVLESTFAVLSVCRRCAKHGFAFVRLPGKRP